MVNLLNRYGRYASFSFKLIINALGCISCNYCTMVFVSSVLFCMQLVMELFSCLWEIPWIISLMQSKCKQNSRYHKSDNYIYMTTGLQLSKLITQVSQVCFLFFGNYVSMLAESWFTNCIQLIEQGRRINLFSILHAH